MAASADPRLLVARIAPPYLPPRLRASYSDPQCCKARRVVKTPFLPHIC